MMNQFFSADYVLTMTGQPLMNAVVETRADGEVVRIWENAEMIPPGSGIRRYRGIIVPGFVNAHCHLELSHLLGLIPRGTGLVAFIKAVIADRMSADKVVMKAMTEADKQMQENGIVAVGDHANTAISRSVKEKSPIYYHTFVEVMGFAPERAGQIMEQAEETAAAFGDLPVSISPHAPYSTSAKLIRMIKKKSREEVPVISIHNQESAEEDKFFKYRTGEFLDLYQWLGQDITYFKSQTRTSLRTVGNTFPADRPVQLVHNTFSTPKDASFADRLGLHIYWCICPTANLYIEGKVPDIRKINQYNRPVTIGTDSLASNDRLCILAEMKAYHRYHPGETLVEMLRWATWNGAELLGITDRYGSIEAGKVPGLNLLENADNLVFNPNITVKKLI